jgi:hypothetical protein
MVWKLAMGSGEVSDSLSRVKPRQIKQISDSMSQPFACRSVKAPFFAKTLPCSMGRLELVSFLLIDEWCFFAME